MDKYTHINPNPPFERMHARTRHSPPRIISRERAGDARTGRRRGGSSLCDAPTWVARSVDTPSAGVRGANKTSFLPRKGRPVRMHRKRLPSPPRLLGVIASITSGKKKLANTLSVYAVLKKPNSERE